MTYTEKILVRRQHSNINNFTWVTTCECAFQRVFVVSKKEYRVMPVT